MDLGLQNWSPSPTEKVKSFCQFATKIIKFCALRVFFFCLGRRETERENVWLWGYLFPLCWNIDPWGKMSSCGTMRSVCCHTVSAWAAEIKGFRMN